MVFDPITNDWVPRWGPDSIKKIQDASDFIIEEKKSDIPIEQQDLFEQKRQMKTLQKSKEEMRELRNKLRRANVDPVKLMKEKKQKVREDKKALDTTLRYAQKSTGSMGVHDKKSKFEADLKQKKKERGPDNIKPEDEKSR